MFIIQKKQQKRKKKKKTIIIESNLRYKKQKMNRYIIKKGLQ